MTPDALLTCTTAGVAVFATIFVVYSIRSARTRYEVPIEVIVAELRRGLRREKRPPLRCRVGDRAVVVTFRPFQSAIGKLVQVEARSSEPHFDWRVRSLGSPFEYPLPARDDDDLCDCLDLCLRPIRDDSSNTGAAAVTAVKRPDQVLATQGPA